MSVSPSLRLTRVVKADYSPFKERLLKILANHPCAGTEIRNEHHAEEEQEALVLVIKECQLGSRWNAVQNTCLACEALGSIPNTGEKKFLKEYKLLFFIQRAHLGAGSSHLKHLN